MTASTTGPSENETIEYLRSVIGDRTRIEWFTDSITGADLVTSPLDVFVRTTEGAVTWGWSVHPIPIDTGGRQFRRFRSADDLVIVVDADEPESIFLPHTTELHSISDGRRATFAIGVAAGSIPPPDAGFDLEKAARMGGAYSIDPAQQHGSVSKALELWVSSLIEATVSFEWTTLTQTDESEIDDLSAGASEPEEDFAGFDAEIADILAPFDSIAWFQGDLTWPDQDNIESFRDHIDVRFRSPTDGLVYLASIGTFGFGADPWITTTGGGALLNFDRGDATRIGLAPDRLVLALSRQEDGYEPAGVATPWGIPPSTEEWAELRTFHESHPESLLIHAPGWSEHRVAEALTVWAARWGDAETEFGYDYSDPIPQATISANEDLADNPTSGNRFVRTDSLNRCGFTARGSAPNEEPFPCGRPATHYFSPGGSSDGVVLVCERHIPSDVSTSPLLK